MKDIKIIIIIILIYLIYFLINNNNNKKEHLDIYFNGNIIEGKCVKTKLDENEYFKKIYSIDENEIIFF